MRNSIVAFGYFRAVRANRPVIAAEVYAEYEERLAAATGLKRLQLRRRMAREVKRRLNQRVPVNGLY